MASQTGLNPNSQQSKTAATADFGGED